jgi:hypothetical protein
VQGYLVKPFNAAPGGVGGPIAAGPLHGDIGTPTASQVDGSATVLTPLQQVQAAVDAGVPLWTPTF